MALNRTIAGFLLLACAWTSALADVAPTEFARIDKAPSGQPRALQLAIVSYAPTDARDFTVDLIGAVHIGDRAYYQALNERFRGYDAVLFELVIPDPDGSEREYDYTGSVMSQMQIGLKDALGLAFQLDEIDYTAPNFVHADMSRSMLSASMDERGESLYVYFWRLFYAAINDYADDPLGLRDLGLVASLMGKGGNGSLKTAVAYEMVVATREGDFLGGESGSALIAARNEHAIGVLREQIDSGVRRIALFYGAAHMTDLERRLVDELGLVPTAVDWTDAWLLGED